jgi:hypothetical protein
MPGFTEGKPIILKLWSFNQNREFELQPEILEGSSTFLKHESMLASLKKFVLNNNSSQEVIKISCSPNPFNDRISIQIQNTGTEKISVEIMDLSGRIIRKLFKGNLQGLNEIIWNGKNEHGTAVPPGLYICKVNQIQTKLIKQ